MPKWLGQGKLCLYLVDSGGMNWNIAVGGRGKAWSSFIPTIHRIIFSKLSIGAPYFEYQTQAV
jgi:hypothetical protein